MEKTIWKKNIALVVGHGNNSGKYYATAYKVPQNYNLKSYIDSISNCLHVNVCDSYKQAKEIAEHWNECYKKNGTYLFS